MMIAFRNKVILMLIALLAAGCASNPEPVDPYNPADSQRSRADQAQDELSSETSRNE